MDPNETPKPLRLLQLPTDLQNDMVRNMDFLAVFHLSTFRAFRKTPNRRTYWTKICLKLQKESEKDYICVVQKETRDERILLDRNAVAREHRVGNKLFVEHSVTDLAKKIESDIEDPRERVLHHLLQTFQFKIKRLTCNRVIDEQNDSFLWNSIPMFDSVYLSKGLVILDEYITMKSEEIEIFLKMIKSAIYTLAVNVDDKNYKFQRALGCQFLDLRYCAGWFEIDNILARENNLMDIRLCKLSDSQTNCILKQWIDGNRSDLMFMKIYAEHAFSDAEVFKDIDSKAWEPSEKVEDPKLSGQTGKLACIKRKCDGRMATVWSYSKLLFFSIKI
ncbi:hypothetical protein B9Z55_023769 [Caenorhabditis nigoni]|nr:hypothetical protein B9Z55_023769 [Caenorhabditis nigoni]